MTEQSPLACSGIPIVAVKSTFSSPFLEEKLGDKNAHSSTIIVTATFPFHHRHQRLFLQKKCHFQPFVKLKLSKKFSWSSPFSKMPKMSHFSGLGNGRLRCVRSIVSGAKPLSLKCWIRTFIPSTFKLRNSRRWPAAAFQLLL